MPIFMLTLALHVKSPKPTEVPEGWYRVSTTTLAARFAEQLSQGQNRSCSAFGEHRVGIQCRIKEPAAYQTQERIGVRV